MISRPPLTRVHGRAADALRPVMISTGVMKYAEGSALIEVGDTRVLVSASLENRVPNFLSGSGRGWMTAEYAMLPRATSSRSSREVTQGRPSGRSAEIQRLIGRSLRAAVDLRLLPDRTLTLDCDVLQADGGTRTAAITGAWVAAAEALGKLYLAGDLVTWPITAQVAAVSVGLVRSQAFLDLDAPEDQDADVDMNVIATADGRLVEVQGTAEKRPYSRDELTALLDLGFAGIAALCEAQRAALGETLADIAALESKGRRKATAPKHERSLWGKP
jgi:ribonuclease PH